MGYQRDGVKTRYLAPYEARNRGAKHVGFPLDVFEAAVLEHLEGINPRDVLPAAEGTADVTTALAAREQDTDQRLARIKARLKNEDESETIMDAVRELEADLKKVREDLNQARQRERAPTAEAWGEFKSIAAALKAAPDPNAVRTRLRAALRRMVDSVWCLFMPAKSGPRIGFVQVVFAGRDKFQTFVIVYRPRHVAAHGAEHPATARVLQLADVAVPGSFDLRAPSRRRRTRARAFHLGRHRP